MKKYARPGRLGVRAAARLIGVSPDVLRVWRRRRLLEGLGKNIAAPGDRHPIWTYTAAEVAVLQCMALPRRKTLKELRAAAEAALPRRPAV